MMIKKVLLLIFGILLVVLIGYFLFYSNDKLEIQLDRCVDGDTAWFLIHGKAEKVRFLGIDTPESVHPNGVVEKYGIEASDYTCDILSMASKIEIEYDIDKKDKYGRVLGWIFVDNNNLSKLLLSKGYAEVKYIYHDYKYVDDLCSVQRDAYLQELGIWNTSNYDYEDNYCSKNYEWE